MVFRSPRNFSNLARLVLIVVLALIALTLSLVADSSLPMVSAAVEIETFAVKSVSLVLVPDTLMFPDETSVGTPTNPDGGILTGPAGNKRGICNGPVLGPAGFDPLPLGLRFGGIPGGCPGIAGQVSVVMS